MIALTLTSGAARAGAWEEFEARCLVPMENVAAPVTNGLTVMGTQSEGTEKLTIYSSVSDELENYFTVGHDVETDRAACGLVLLGMSEFPTKIIEPLGSWSDDQIAQGRYENAETDGLHSFNLVRSTTWREPKMEVEFFLFGPALYLTAKETDLES